ncbi:HupE/UreJ family protein [Phenylobacterium sp.]|uniref:HupE/UreJ family protein n=1 Tax=Phenylobacterium sp. TaxID=1871053 RepID=UPI0025DD0D40|nr:HupE/UreJ family protein [Phenylobacterium sp.]MBX3485614.1 HupE/UreJ family protein [Phenylobacterium sp.]MCW5761108.1 HupE/UreJ family protein [Phenylobacterium sp.]
MSVATRLWMVVALVLGLLAATPAAAHEVRPALMQITETGPGHWSVFWKQPAMGDVALRLSPHLSGGWLEQPPADQYVAPGFMVKTWDIRSPAPLDGQTLTIQGLEQSITDVLVQVSLADGRRVETMVRPEAPHVTLALAARPAPAVPAYLKLGVEHILTGVDHLMFVLGLLLLVGINWRIVKAVTAFTVAHSLTLAAAALGWVHAPSAVVEALVALSIVFVALELVRDPGGETTLTRRHPWLVAFAFGLLHGLAFAGALAEIGLPPKGVVASLFLFNVGVEIGQLVFIAVAIVVILALRRLRGLIAWNSAPLARLAPPYAIGAFATFWFIERLGVAFQ